MLLMTHVKMARVLGRTLQIPNIKYFLKGVKIPDSGLNPFFIRHIKNNTLFEVKLLLDANESKWITPEAFSYNIGVITHYVMDYFCRFHENDLMFDQTIKHVLHEMRLEFTWWSFKHTIEKFLMRTITVIDEIEIDTFDAVEFLELRLREYYTMPHSYEKDLEYAFITSYIIGLILIFRWHRQHHYFKEANDNE